MSTLGSGTYGNVQKDREDSTMAIKTLHFMNLHSAIREVVILKQINHPNIIKLHRVEVDFPEFQLNLYIERFECDLDRFMEQRTMTPDIIRKFSQGLFSAMLYLHKKDIIHRDIAPGNILIKWDKGSSANKNYQMVLCDFGLAVASIDPKQTKLDTGVCTATYRAPEIYTGISYSKYNNNIDVWSYGCVLYYLITGVEMMIWEEYDEFFIHKRKEASRYLCHFFELPDHNNHLTRMKVLKRLDTNTLSKFFIKQLRKFKVSKPLQDEYLPIILQCLVPNPKLRCNSQQLADKYPNLLSVENIRDGSDTEKSVKSVVDKPFSCFSRSIKGFDKDLDEDRDFEGEDISKMITLAKQTPVWELANKLYNRLLEKRPIRDTVIWLSGCLYIASQVLEIDDGAFELHLLDLCTPIQFGFVVVYILHTLDWTLYSVQ